MANTIAELLPDSAKFDGAGNFPQRMEQGTAPKRVVLAFDAATDEAAYWKFIARQGLTGTMKIIIQYWMASATTGTIAFEVSIEKRLDRIEKCLGINKKYVPLTIVADSAEEADRIAKQRKYQMVYRR